MNDADAGRACGSIRGADSVAEAQAPHRHKFTGKPTSGHPSNASELLAAVRSTGGMVVFMSL